MTDALALRTSVLTEYHTDPEPGFKSTDNTFGVSVVYSFN
jgi:putative salt-induced outer membrane protein